MTTTDKVRELIPVVLKENNKSMTFDELFKGLKKQIPELVEDGKDRTGVLRGVINKLDTIPIKNLVIEKKDKNVRYAYIDNKFEDLVRLSEEFVDELNKRELLSINVLELSEDEIQKYHKYQKIIFEISNLNKEHKSIK